MGRSSCPTANAGGSGMLIQPPLMKSVLPIMSLLSKTSSSKPSTILKRGDLAWRRTRRLGGSGRRFFAGSKKADDQSMRKLLLHGRPQIRRALAALSVVPRFELTPSPQGQGETQQQHV